jgi:hypothetical protein
MTQLSKRLAQIVRKELSKNLIPVKTDQGILIGDILIKSQHNLKFIYRSHTVCYTEIHLNSAAIKIANLLALRRSSIQADTIYKADQEYGRWYIDSQLLHTQHNKAVSKGDFNRADTLWAKYCQSRDRCIKAKNYVDSLLRIE